MADAQQAVFAWGAGEDGQLGLAEAPANQDEWHVAAVTPVPFFASVPLRADASGVAPPLVGGSRTSLAVSADGQLFTWGWNEKRSLGLGHTRGAATPAALDALPAGVRVAQACWGGWHGLAVTTEGEAYAWGGNENLQTGATDVASESLPLPARILPSLRVLQVSAGGMHSLALVAGGDVWTWGQPLTTWGASADTNLYGKQRAPLRVAGADNVVRIAAGAFHNLALTGAGHVLAWGNSDYGQLGLGSTTHVAEPNVVAELSGVHVTALAAGGWHSAAVTAEGGVFVWGRGEHGRLGLGETCRDRHAPVRLPLPPGARAAAVSLGGTHSLLLTHDGALLSCGRQSFGRLGRAAAPDNHHTFAPVELPPPPRGAGRWRVEAISAGGRHSLALARGVPHTADEGGPVGADGLAAQSRRAAGAAGARVSLTFAPDVTGGEEAAAQ